MRLQTNLPVYAPYSRRSGNYNAGPIIAYYPPSDAKDRPAKIPLIEKLSVSDYKIVPYFSLQGGDCILRDDEIRLVTNMSTYIPKDFRELPIVKIWYVNRKKEHASFRAFLRDDSDFIVVSPEVAERYGFDENFKQTCRLL